MRRLCLLLLIALALPLLAEPKADAAAVKTCLKGYFTVYMTHPDHPWKSWGQAKPYVTPDLFQLVQRGIATKKSMLDSDLIGGSAGGRPSTNGQFQIGNPVVSGNMAKTEVTIMCKDQDQSGKPVIAMKTKVEVTSRKVGGKWLIDDFDNWDLAPVRETMKLAVKKP